ncbi:5-nucleotidase [Lactobacillus delbrueckii subsp. delbrueckii DSM 20074 = JCM 1012]|uniref:bifunctional metallophosphatase/5'-nucleotidase n=1 Tax=Lactobacillus delbrueckii TaxID=1584 RepID=UPI00069AF33B|nr:bifunctional UDP-sugar hydrolase/5'-nucleotidase [Lactobacillus delbrueckii]APP10052.1 multifunctional 2',3'-cyclic-nucleotide 2'-phosphodiesterase/5'-nucleotidase/3'-nucleotidase [Lactobacillus delbrueckii subsp. delbrueckii DSM 20074 = JCM 1012]KNZ37770.1 5'-nucleotidase [Lactobacillus delbrueckii subsp. delbrueckii]KRK18883.1 5-nucleotidase [Lactobacillus delbrueckii subsp. delbrueckii DSM 20074 = JCM 1012]MCD5451532.1 bifunctional metallophosphatase/5'-nucleotidase [Lactobacillus delbrue
METLRILHTNDLHSHFEHFPKIRRYLKQVQETAAADQVLTFDAGDFMDRSHPLSDATEGRANIRLMNDFHYDAITIGNNEGISNPHAVLERLFDHANFPVLLSNLREEDESWPAWANDYKIIKTKKGTRLALVGLTAAYPMTYGPNHWQIKMLGETMDRVLPEIAGQYDCLILLTHVGLRMDQWLAKHYPEIDLIVGGHSHTLLEKGVKEGRTWITQTGKWGNYVGDISLEIGDDHKIISIKPTTVPVADLPSQAGDEAEIAALYEEGQKMLQSRQVADLPEKFKDDKLAAIDVSLDAIADFAGTDLAMLSTGLFLTPFKSGLINQFDLQHALPHPMHVVRTTLLGRDLWRLVMEVEKNRHFLEHYPLVGMGFRGKIFGQVYYRGIKYDPMTRNVFVNGQLLDPAEEYRIAVLDHYVLIPFFPTLAIVGENEFLFPQFLREVVGDYLGRKYPVKKEGEFIEERAERAENRGS